jgi:response regulator of citrate/malate metabolism
MTGGPTKVLVVEDEAVAARALVEEIAAAPGFVVAGHTHSGADTLRTLAADDAIDLVLLDIQLPDMSGIDLLRRLRATGCHLDVMVVTVLRDPSVLQAAMALGVVHYLLKPFTAAAVRQKLEQYQAFRTRRLAVTAGAVDQQEIDEIFTALRAMAVGALPNGVGQETLHAVTWSTSPSPGWPNGAPATAEPADPRSNTDGPTMTRNRRLRPSPPRDPARTA